MPRTLGEQVPETKKRNHPGYCVKIAESAFIDMCLSALEAYCVKHKKRQKKPLETFGLLWGHETELTDGRILYTIQKAGVDTSTKRKPDECMPNSDSLNLKYDFMSSFFPDVEFLGDFHTHPYLKTGREISKKCLYDASSADINSIQGFPEKYIPLNFRVSLVITIGNVQEHFDEIMSYKKPDSPNMIAFRFGHYRFWIQAYVVYQHTPGTLKMTTNHTQLQVSGIPLDRAYTKFGDFEPDLIAHVRASEEEQD